MVDGLIHFSKMLLIFFGVILVEGLVLAILSHVWGFDDETEREYWIRRNGGR